MGSTELAANLFRATQTEEKLRRDEVDTKQLANQTHNEVGQKVRQTIKETWRHDAGSASFPGEKYSAAKNRREKEMFP